ncbi:hypothetical protein AB0N50_36235 [Streptomyces pharetrae]|uniref:hypothetical protein n=1 Tax=Streptomyces pharetrae TaxID=291370 RepID=UPI003460AEF7
MEEDTAGWPALDALLGLAVPRRDVVDAGQLRAVLAVPGVRDGGVRRLGRRCAWP